MTQMVVQATFVGLVFLFHFIHEYPKKSVKGWLPHGVNSGNEMVGTCLNLVAEGSRETVNVEPCREQKQSSCWIPVFHSESQENSALTLWHGGREREGDEEMERKEREREGEREREKERESTGYTGARCVCARSRPDE